MEIESPGIECDDRPLSPVPLGCKKRITLDISVAAAINSHDKEEGKVLERHIFFLLIQNTLDNLQLIQYL